MLSRITQSPALVRSVPFVLFLVLTFFQDRIGEAGRYWIYFLKTVIGAGMLFAIHGAVSELKWHFSWEAIVVGIAVFVMWVGLDPAYPRLDRLYPDYVCPSLRNIGLAQSCPLGSAERAPWNPHVEFGAHSSLAAFFILVRIVGSTLVVPPLEELFYRSFLYRFLARKDFLSLPLGRFMPVPFLVTSIVFGFAHYEWLAGILCGFLYQGLVVWKGRLGDAVTAHATTNLLLGLWVLWRGAWHFW